MIGIRDGPRGWRRNVSPGSKMPAGGGRGEEIEKESEREIHAEEMKRLRCVGTIEMYPMSKVARRLPTGSRGSCAREVKRDETEG